MKLLESNRQLIHQYVHAHGILAILNSSSTNISELSRQIEPQSAKAKFARRFRRIIKSEVANRLLVDETRRLFSRFLKDWTEATAQWVLAMRSSDQSITAPYCHTLATDNAVLKVQLKETLEKAEHAEQLSKKQPFFPIKMGLNPLVLVPDKDATQVSSVFKVLSGTQMAGELASYFIGLFSHVDFFHCVVPSYCWVNQMGRKERSMGILSNYHGQCHTAFESYCAQSKGLQALQSLPDEFVQGICLMHLLRGSEDAHMKNTMIQTTTDPHSGEEVVVRIHEIDGEHIMSSSEPHSDRFGGLKSVASMRIWWLGLSQAGKPLSMAMLNLILSWSRDKLLDLHAHIGLYPEQKIQAQVWRLENMRRLARQALLESKPLTAREIFAELIYDHPTLLILSKNSSDLLQVYNRVGNLSTEQASRESTQPPTPVTSAPLTAPLSYSISKEAI